jgi:hypothetical protein
MGHARRFLHGRYARLEPFAQTDDVVQQLFLKILQNQDRFWVNADGEPVRTLAEFFGHSSAWLRDVFCALLRKAYGLPPDGCSPVFTFGKRIVELFKISCRPGAGRFLQVSAFRPD